LVITHERCGQHEVGVGHPERPARLSAALAGLARTPDSIDAVDFVASRPESLPDILRVHDAALVGAALGDRRIRAVASSTGDTR
jgi:acetoin utilization deacetylase AcuC-like enzyme